MTHYKTVSTKTVADLLDYASRVKHVLDKLKEVETEPGVFKKDVPVQKQQRLLTDYDNKVAHLLNFIEQMEI